MQNVESLLKTVFQNQEKPNSQESARRLRNEIFNRFADIIADAIDKLSGSCDEFNQAFPLDCQDFLANFMFSALQAFQNRLLFFLDCIDDVCIKAIKFDRFCYSADIGYFVEIVGETYKRKMSLIGMEDK